MACFDDLPDELLSAVCEYLVPLRQFVPETNATFQVRMATNRLRRSTLVSLCRTAKRYNRIAQAHLYSSVVVNDPTTRACERLDHLLGTIISNPKLAALVRYAECIPQNIEGLVERSNRPHEQAIYRVASTIFTLFDASVFMNVRYGDKFAVAQITLLLYLTPNIAHLSYSTHTEFGWMETPLLLQALGLQSAALPTHSELPPFPKLEYVYLFSTKSDDSTSSNAASPTPIPWKYTLGAAGNLPSLRHYVQSGVRYGFRTTNIAMLHTLCLHDTLVPIESVCIAIGYCAYLHTFMYSMASEHGGSSSRPDFDASAVSRALFSSKDTLQTLVLVHSRDQQPNEIRPLTSLKDLVALKALTVSVGLIKPLWEHYYELGDYLPPSVEMVRVCLQGTTPKISLRRLDDLAEKKIECRVESEFDVSMMG